MIEIKNGTKAILLSGDRDRVGNIVTIEDIQPDGKCKMNFGFDFCLGNTKEVDTDPGNSKYYQGFDYCVIENQN